MPIDSTSLYWTGSIHGDIHDQQLGASHWFGASQSMALHMTFAFVCSFTFHPFLLIPVFVGFHSYLASVSAVSAVCVFSCRLPFSLAAKCAGFIHLFIGSQFQSLGLWLCPSLFGPCFSLFAILLVCSLHYCYVLFSLVPTFLQPVFPAFPAAVPDHLSQSVASCFCCTVI